MAQPSAVVLFHEAIISCVQYYASLSNKQLQKGQDYLEHKPVVAIWILDQQLFDGANWLHAFRWRDSIKSNNDIQVSACEAITILHQDACIITIELPVWLRLNQGGENTIVTEAERWNFFLTQSHGEEERRILANLGDPIFKEALDIMATFTLAEKLRHSYNMRRNYEHIVASYKRTGYEEGKAEGRMAGLTEGLAEGRAGGKAEGKAEANMEIARKMKARGLNPDDIAEFTGLSLEELALL